MIKALSLSFMIVLSDISKLEKHTHAHTAAANVKRRGGKRRRWGQCDYNSLLQTKNKHAKNNRIKGKSSQSAGE
jgi:hypothetical protein